MEIKYAIHFDYTQMNEVMMVMKQCNCSILEKEMQLFCNVVAGIPANRVSEVLYRLKELQNVDVKKMSWVQGMLYFSLNRDVLPSEKKYKSFWSFYPYYLTEHGDAKNRTLHFIGTLLIIVFVVAGIVTRNWWLIAAVPVCGYGFAWVGHFFIEKNRPATFTYPL